MPDFEDKIPISEFSYTNTLHNTDQAPIIQQDGADWDNFRTSMADIGLHINKDMEYVTDLHTTSKNIIGAINELADGGASADITTEIDTPSSIQTFSDGGDNIPMKSCEVAIVAVQSGTGTPSPSNPRAITGFSSVDVVVNGQNFIDFSTAQVRPVQEGSSTERVGFAPVTLSAGVYHIRKTYSGSTSQLYIQDYITGTNIANNNANEFDFTLTATTNVIVRTTAQTMEQFNLTSLLCVLKSDTTTHTIALPETIYGGTAELVGGNGSKTWESLTDLANGDWSSQGEGDYQFFALSVSGADTTRLAELLCNKYRTLTPGLTNTDDNIVGIISSGTVLRIRDKRYNATTINDFKTSLSDCIVIFPKATPTAFTFTGANIPTLGNGQINNVYADSGDVNALEYFNEKADDIASMVRLMTRT